VPSPSQYAVYAAALIFALGGCEPQRSSSPEGRETTHRYHPYGVPVPPTALLDGPLEPYTPELHGPMMPSSAVLAAPMYAPRRVRLSSVEPDADVGLQLPPSYNSSEGGWRLTYDTRGVMSLYDLQLDVALPSGEAHLYAPTTIPHDDSCIEATMIHRRLATDSVTQHFFGLWNWCDPQRRQQFEIAEEITAAWKQKYVRLRAYGTEPAEEVFQISVAGTPGGCWYAAIGNFETGNWEERTPNGWCGVSYKTSDGRGGWSMFELERVTSGCVGLPSIRASEAEILTRDARDGELRWLPPNVPPSPGIITSTQSIGCFAAKGPSRYTFHTHSGEWEVGLWHAHTPQP